MVVKSGAQFPLRADDWRFFNKSVPEVVQRYHADGYKVVIFRCAGRVVGYRLLRLQAP